MSAPVAKRSRQRTFNAETESSNLSGGTSLSEPAGDPRLALVHGFQRARRDPGLAVLEGFHPLKHALRFGAVVERAVAVDPAEVVALARRLAPDVAERLGSLVAEVPEEVFARLVPRPPHTGVVAIARRPKPDLGTIARDAPWVLLEDPRDPANLGACVRVAAAAGAAAVSVTGDRDAWSPDALRGSAGLHFALPVLAAAPERRAGRPLVALDPGGDPFHPRALPEGAVLAFGTEREGLSDALLDEADARLALPMRPGVSSLNLATSVSAVLYAWRLTRS